MKRETAKRLLDAYMACNEVQDFSVGRTVDALWEDRLLQLGLHKLLEIIGEALSQAIKSDPAIAPSIPDARRYIAVRNRITHGYDSVDYTVIWQICTERIPSLATALDALLTEQYPDWDTYRSDRHEPD